MLRSDTRPSPNLHATASSQSTAYSQSKRNHLQHLIQLVPFFWWNIAEGITLVVRRHAGYNGINPGACVGVDVILWLGLMTAVCFLAPGFGQRSAYYIPRQNKPTLQLDSLTPTNALISLGLFK